MINKGLFEILYDFSWGFVSWSNSEKTEKVTGYAFLYYIEGMVSRFRH